MQKHMQECVLPKLLLKSLNNPQKEINNRGWDKESHPFLIYKYMIKTYKANTNVSIDARKTKCNPFSKRFVQFSLLLAQNEM